MNKLIQNKVFGNLSNMATSQIKAVLIDLSGTLHVDDEPTPNAIEALTKLRNANVHIRFVTNTTKESGDTLLKRLQKIGFTLNRSEIYSSLSAAVNYVQENKIRNPFYLLTEDAKLDFLETAQKLKDNDDDGENYDAVIVGLAPECFYYENLNKAFNILIKSKCPLIAIHEGKYYKRKDGLAIGPGFFTRGLEYAAAAKSIVIGKPNEYFFQNAIPNGVNVEECVMIGDDINDDIKGALEIGIKGILVKTGKYLPDNPAVDIVQPTKILDNFSEAVNWLILNKFKV